MARAQRAIKTLMVPPYTAPQIAYLPVSIEGFNRMVSIGAAEIGVATSKKLENGIYILYYGSGYFTGLHANRRVNDEVIFGTFYVVGTDAESRPRSLSDEEILWYDARFGKPDAFTDSEALDIQLNMFFKELETL